MAPFFKIRFRSTFLYLPCWYDEWSLRKSTNFDWSSMYDIHKSKLYLCDEL